jgi:hypothetical protein
VIAAVFVMNVLVFGYALTHGLPHAEAPAEGPTAEEPPAGGAAVEAPAAPAEPTAAGEHP